MEILPELGKILLMQGRVTQWYQILGDVLGPDAKVLGLECLGLDGRAVVTLRGNTP